MEKLIIKIIFIIIYVVFRITLVIPWIFTHFLISAIFNKRCEFTQKRLYVEDFEGLREQKLQIKSGKETLAGGIYTSEKAKSNGALMVFVHGIGCGKNNYYNRINYFAKKGFTVLAYDGTGCCESSGKGMVGLSRGIIDLNNVLDYVLVNDKFGQDKMVLYGHSWGGYSVTSILNGDKNDHIDAVVCASGFNDPIDMLCYQCEGMLGKLVKLSVDFIKLVDWCKFGKVSRYTAINGINKFNKPVFVAHSDDDETIIYDYSVLNKAGKCTNNNAEFHLFFGKGHTLVRPYENIERLKKSFETTPAKMPLFKENIFKLHFDASYRNADINDLYAVDEDYLNKINDFYTKTLI